MQWMIYGANGYTGELIARQAVSEGLQPVLAGRNAARVQALADELGLEARAFGLDDAGALADGLRGMALVLHCAGPFSATSAPMIEGCLAVGSHYLDISGEITVFEHAHAQSARAAEAGIVICPGVGFDVIPTDCVALTLKQAMPDATRLALGFDSRSGFSPGTAKTSVEGLAQGGQIRRNGEITPVPLAWRTRQIDFGDGEKLAMTIPWGDVATAFHTTGIPNIEVYIPGSPRLISNARRANHLRWLLRLGPVQALLKRRIGRTVRGPDAAARERMPTFVWGEVRNAAGQIVEARVRTLLREMTHGGKRAGDGQAVAVGGPDGGTYTPATLMGADLVERLPGSGSIAVGTA